MERCFRLRRALLGQPEGAQHKASRRRIGEGRVPEAPGQRLVPDKGAASRHRDCDRSQQRCPQRRRDGSKRRQATRAVAQTHTQPGGAGALRHLDDNREVAEVAYPRRTADTARSMTLEPSRLELG